MGLSVRLQKSMAGFFLDAAWDAGDEIVVLFGYSGSGKSMTLRMIAGLAAPDEGHVCCSDQVMYDSDKGIDLPPQARGMGYVGQEPALFPHLTVSKNIGFGLKDLNREERKARVAEMVEVFRLEGLEDRAPAHLSGGQKQRVALARALARHPRGLLLDEPFSALDLPLRNELWQVLCDVQSGFALPVVVVTHDPYEARAMADRIVVYSAGRTVRSGTPEQVMVRPDRPEIDTLLTGWGVSRVGVA